MAELDLNRALQYGGVWGLLSKVAVGLGTTKSAFWPFWENTGQAISGLGAPSNLVPRDQSAARNLEDEWSPAVTNSGVHYAVKNVRSTNNHFSAGDHSDYSYGNGTVDAPLSMGMFVAPSSFAAVTSLFGKYNSAAEEYDFRIASGGNLELELHDASASAAEIATATTALALNQLQHVVVTYDGGQTSPVVKFYINAVLAGEAAAVQTGSYVAMQNTGTPLLLLARGLTAAPSREFDGWMAMPFMTGKELTAQEVGAVYTTTRALVGV